MYTKESLISTVVAILPEAHMQATVAELNEAGHNVLRSHARGTLQDNRWYRKFLPAISPEKGTLRLLLPNSEVEAAMRIIINRAKLHRQSTGAIYSIPCNEVFVGDDFQSSCSIEQVESCDATASLKENLDVIQCIVEKHQTDGIASAAIAAGAHGPIVHYSEGYGLRDRLGWLRITKQAEKEVLTVIVDNAKADSIFAAMANAGQLHLPGRGFMYQMPVTKGLFNLPSHIDGQRYPANMQQIIGALDHLMGDDHWRDQTVFELEGTGKTAGLGFLANDSINRLLDEQACLTAIVDREHAAQLMELMIDVGAPGLNVSYCQRITTENQHLHEGVSLLSEYAIINCVAGESLTHDVLHQTKLRATEAGINNLCLHLQPVPRVATYLHHPNPERRRNAAERAA